MATVEGRSAHATHEVSNQASPLENYNVFESNRVLVEALRREGGEWAEDRVSEVGAFSGSEQAKRWGREANENEPRLVTHDRFGHRIDEVEFHPAWHELMRAGIGFGIHSLPWTRSPAGRARRARRDVHVVHGRRRRRLPDLDDLLGDPRDPRAARDRRRNGTVASSRPRTTRSACAPRPTRPAPCAEWA